MKALVEVIVRDICERDPASPDSQYTVCISVQDLELILDRHLGIDDELYGALQKLEKRLRIRSTDFERRANMEEYEASRQWQLGRSEALDDVADEIAAMIEVSNG